MKRELQRIEPWSAVRIGFFSGLLGGFLLGLLNGAIVKYLAGVLGDKALPPEMLSMVNLSGGAIFALCIVLSLMSSLIFAVFGLVSALCYNLIARTFGGLEIHVAGDDHSPADPTASRPPEEEEAGHD